MAHKKAAGSAENLRDSKPKYRWVKLFGGQIAKAGDIIIRQNGDKYDLGTNVYKGRDFTIHASIGGVVVFKKRNVLRFDGRRYLKTVVDIQAGDVVVVEKAPKTPKAAKTPVKKADKPAKAPAKKVAEPKAEKVPAKAAAPKAAAKTPAKAPAKKAPAKKAAK
jgi:large subunit ribosomal protein L27